jgi:DNA polymerase III subunit delta'
VNSDETDLTRPRDADALFGHAEAERTLLDSYRTGQIPHAWLIGGPPGIGKATLAYRMARFVLANPDPSELAVQQAQSLAVSKEHPVTRRISNQAHPDLLVLRRTINEKTGKLHQDIAVDDIRRTVPFFGSTPGEGGWRVAIVDSVEELNRSGENALLKVLEEPPPRSLLLLVSNAPGRVLPTIRSRCRVLLLRPLSEHETARAAAAVLGRTAEDADLMEAAGAAGGSAATALKLLDGPALALRHKIIDLLKQLPAPDPQTMHALGDALAGTDQMPLATFRNIVNDWLSQRLAADVNEKSRAARVAQIWQEINGAARDVEAYNLDRKPLVFAVFGLLSEAVR